MPITPKQRFLLIAPVIVVPFLAMIFYVLDGGAAVAGKQWGKASGLNTELPGVVGARRLALLNKMATYLRADQDSMRKREVERRDPYHRYLRGVKAVDSVQLHGRADTLVRQLERLQVSIRQPRGNVAERPMREAVAGWSTPEGAPRWQRPLTERIVDTPEADPQLERLNSMLDKVIRIQHPEAAKPVAASDAVKSEVVLAADSASNAMAAVIPVDQTLTSGGAISLRLEEDVLIHGQLISRGQWVYGVVAINQDRMLVHIRSMRVGLNIYPVDLQVYDLDGLPGIHIPGMLGREVAKESADEGIGGLNLVSGDASLSASAAEAGIQAAKTLMRRKVRLVRVAVRAGYQVLLRDARAVNAVRMAAPVKDSFQVSFIDRSIQPPGIDPGGSFLRRSREGGIELGLQGIWLKDGLLWFALSWRNGSPIAYNPDYCRWFIRDRRKFRRTAEQELELDAVEKPPLRVIEGDSSECQWTGFRPFALGEDKELVVEFGERNGGRTLELAIGHKVLLKAKRAP